MHLVKFDPYNLIIHSNLTCIDNIFFQVAITVADENPIFSDLNAFYANVESIANQSVMEFVSTFENNIIHQFSLVSGDSNIEPWKKGYIFIVADVNEDVKKSINVGKQILGRKTIWSFCTPEFLLKGKVISEA